MAPAEPQQYILRSPSGLYAEDPFDPATKLLTQLPQATSADPPIAATLQISEGIAVRVVDSIADNGPKLIELTAGNAARLRLGRSGLRIAPIVYYHLAPARKAVIEAGRVKNPDPNAPTFRHVTGVRVGIIDTGVDSHRDLNLTGGRNTVTGEPASDYGDPDGQGTLIAALVGAHGRPPTGIRGVAAGVALRSYRVFSARGGGATNYAIAKALAVAKLHRCDVVNLSLHGDVDDDEITPAAVADARDAGMLVVSAPVVAGAAACLLSQDQDLFSAARDRARSDQLARSLFASSSPPRFGEILAGLSMGRNRVRKQSQRPSSQ